MSLSSVRDRFARKDESRRCDSCRASLEADEGDRCAACEWDTCFGCGLSYEGGVEPSGFCGICDHSKDIRGVYGARVTVTR